MITIYLVLRRSARRGGYYKEMWTEDPHPGDYFLLLKEVQTIGEHEEAIKMLGGNT